MPTFDININITVRVNTPRLGHPSGTEREIRTRMDDEGGRGTVVSEKRFWEKYVKEQLPIFAYMVDSRRNIRADEVTVTLVP